MNKALINALKSYEQYDEEGIMCVVSRQAVEEVITEIEKLESALDDILNTTAGEGGDSYIMQDIAREALGVSV